MSSRSKPQPDLLLLRARSYASGGARSEDVLLLVEVADSSLDYDRTVKLRVYARAGIPEYWIVDTEAEAVDVHREPTADGYRTVQRLGRDRVLAPLAFSDVALPVNDIFA